MSYQNIQGRICTGYKDLDLKSGEEVQVLSGIQMEVPPESVTVIREYPHMILLQLTFVKSYFPSVDLTPRTYRICVHKGALLCGDVILRKVKERMILTGEEAGNYVYVQ